MYDNTPPRPGAGAKCERPATHLSVGAGRCRDNGFRAQAQVIVTS